MQLTRRSLAGGLGRLGLSFVAAGAFLETACPAFGSVFSSILKYVGTGLQAFQTVLDLLSGLGIINIGAMPAIDALIALVKSGFADLQIAVSDYENAPAASKQTLLGKISTAIAALMSTIQQFWSDLNIPDPKLAETIKGLLGLILSTLSGFLTQLPAPAAGSVRVTAKQIPVHAEKKSMGEFKKEFNNILDQQGYGKYKRF